MGTYCECGNKRFSELHGDMVDDEWVCECCQLTAKKDQRIAELEQEQVTLAKDAYHRGLQDGRDVTDDLLEWLIAKAHYAGAWGEKCDKAEAILAKRKEEQ